MRCPARAITSFRGEILVQRRNSVYIDILRIFLDYIKAIATI
jgi:hypothetical protein